MSKGYVQHGDGAVDMAGLTTLRSFLAKVKTHTLRDESKDQFGRVAEDTAS